MSALTLPSGTTYCHGRDGERICTGSQMGRPNVYPDDRSVSVKLNMERLRWVDGDYDQWGAYWGGGSHDFIYCAWCPLNPEVYIFVRARGRLSAKVAVLEILPNARFYR